MNNYSSLIINSGGSLTIENGGRISSSVLPESKSSIKNSGSIINNGALHLDDGTSFYSPGGLVNKGTADLKGKVIGTDSGFSITNVEVTNSGTVELGDKGSCLVADVELSISNKSDGAKVIVNYVQGILSVLNSIDASDSDTVTIIKADHFQVKGLTIKSVITDGGVANDLSGTVSVGNQIKDFTSEGDFKAHRVIEALGDTTVKGELSSGLGVSIQVGRLSQEMNLFLIEGTLSTQCGDITVNGGAVYYCSNHLENVRFTVAGEYRAIGSSFLFDRAVEAEFAKFDISGGSISTTLEEAISHKERIGNCIWLRGNTLIDGDFEIPKNVELVVLNDIKVNSGNRLTVNGVLSLGFEKWMNKDGTKEPVYGRLVLDNSADIAINGVISSRVDSSLDIPNVCDVNGHSLTIPGAYYSVTETDHNGEKIKTIYISTLSKALANVAESDNKSVKLKGKGSVIIAKDERLNVPEGCQVHISAGIELLIEENGSLTSKGKIEVIAGAGFVIRGTLMTSADDKTSDSGIVNSGQMENHGIVTIGVNTSLKTSSGSLTNSGTLTVNGEIVGSEQRPVENQSEIVLSGKAIDLHVTNADNATVKIEELDGNLAVINNSDNNTRTIVCSDYFPLKGLTISSIGAVNVLSGTVSVGNQIKNFTSEDDFNAHRVIKALGYTTVNGALSLGRGVSFQAGDASSSESSFLIEGDLSTVCGKINVNVGTGSVSLDCSNHLENVRFTVAGEYRAIGSSFLFDRAVEAEFAKFDISGGSISTTLEEAISHKERIGNCIWLRGNTLIDGDFEIPEGVELVVLNDIKVNSGNRLTVNGVLSLGFEKWMNKDGTKEPVYGRLVLDNSADITINGVLSSRVDSSSDIPNVCDVNGKSLTIPGAYYSVTKIDHNKEKIKTIYISTLSKALANVAESDNKSVKLKGKGSVIIAKDERLNVPEGCQIHISADTELVVGGDLTATAAGSKITFDGLIRVIDNGSIKTIVMLNGKIDAVMYKTEEGSATVYNYVSPDSASGGGGTEYEISGEVTISTPIKGDLKFIGKDGSGSTVTIKADVKSDSLILADVTVVIESGREISAILKDESGSTIEIRGKAGEGFSVSSNSGSMKISGKMQGDSELIVSSGITADGVTVSKMEVESGGSIAFNGSSIVTTLSVTGIITVNSGASLKSDFISIFGSLISQGNIDVKRILIGVLDSIISFHSLTLGAFPSVAGSLTVEEYMVVSPGSDVSGVAGIESYGKTSYFAKDNEYVTVYANASSGTKIGIIDYHIDDAEWLGWYAGNRISVDVSDSNVGDYSTVHAIIDYDIYSIAIAADKAVSKVFIDGEPMTRNSDGTWSASVAAGHHEITVKLKAGYVGTGVLAVQSGGPGISMDGMGFEVSGDRSEFNLALSGFSWVGWVDPDPEPPIPFPVPTPSSSSDDGVTAADCLLVVLIGIVAIMSIVLAGRMLRR